MLENRQHMDPMLYSTLYFCLMVVLCHFSSCPKARRDRRFSAKTNHGFMQHLDSSPVCKRHYNLLQSKMASLELRKTSGKFRNFMVYFISREKFEVLGLPGCSTHPENFHKFFCKDPGRRCSMIRKNWELRAALRLQEWYAIGFLRDMMGDDDEYELQSDLKSTKAATSTKFEVYFDRDENAVAHTWRTRTNVGDILLEKNMLEFIANEHGLENSGKRITCRTESWVVDENGNQISVRCHPNFRGYGKWNDWGFVDVNSRRRPAKFGCWVEKDDGKLDAIVQYASERDPRKESIFGYCWKFPKENEKYEGATMYHVVKEEDYLSECYVIGMSDKQEIFEVEKNDLWWRLF